MSDVPLTSTVSGLSDRRLLEQIKEMVEREQHFTLVIVDHLREIEARSLHLERGFGSLFDYTVTELGYTPSAAWRRIQAMRLSSQIDGVRERLEDGTLTVTAATQLQTAFDRNRRQAAAAAVAVGAEAEAPPVLDVSARTALVEQAAGKSTREVERMLASVDPTLVPPREKVRRLTDGKWELKAVIDDECERELKELKRLLSHTNPSMTYGELVGRLVREGLDRHDPGRRGSRRAGGSAPKSDEKPAANGASAAKSSEKPAATAPSAAKLEGQPAANAGSAAKSARHSAPNGTSPVEAPTEQARAITSAPKEKTRPAGASGSAPKSEEEPPANAGSAPKERGGRTIPRAIKREVWHRDQGRCRYVDPVSGRRCNSRYLLQIDHIRRYALGGGADPDNLRLLCAAHHRHRHAARAASGEAAATVRPPRFPADSLTILGRAPGGGAVRVRRC